ncbi:hypothetical protein [Lewinella sp. IMCC34183]|uniref:hypothetical protein n=1 Tax=Lewinella sp. IMCC34183 TaxID=2248762 RepID=UPI0013002917|nr:hypothetical protein [Lewinella sp. IMCC34183]
MITSLKADLNEEVDISYIKIPSSQLKNIDEVEDAVISQLLLACRNNFTILAFGSVSIVIMNSILKILGSGKSDHLRNIDQIIFVSPIIFRDKLAFKKIHVYSALWSILNFKSWRLAFRENNYLSTQKGTISRIAEQFYRRIIAAESFSASQAMIPTAVLFNPKDSLLDRRSIESVFFNKTRVKEKYLTFPSFGSETLSLLSSIVKNPKAHKNVFWIKSLAVNIKIFPVQFEKIDLLREKLIADHKGEVRLKFDFHPENSSILKFNYRFSVGINGNIEEITSFRDFKNETDSSNIGRFERDGNEFIVEFVPRSTSPHKLALDVLNGFDDSQEWDRNSELEKIVRPAKKRQYFYYPFGNGEAKYDNVLITINLEKYLGSHAITEPQLYIIDTPMSLEFTDSDEITSLILSDYSYIPGKLLYRGVYSWELKTKERGVFVVTWEVETNDQNGN